jgi:hypothetical protein
MLRGSENSKAVKNQGQSQIMAHRSRAGTQERQAPYRNAEEPCTHVTESVASPSGTSASRTSLDGDPNGNHTNHGVRLVKKFKGSHAVTNQGRHMHRSRHRHRRRHRHRNRTTMSAHAQPSRHTSNAKDFVFQQPNLLYFAGLDPKYFASGCPSIKTFAFRRS